MSLDELSDLACKEFKPEKGKGNKHAKKNWLWFLAFMGVYVIPVVVLQWYGAKYWWPNDRTLELRWLAKTLLKLSVAMIAAEGYLVYKDWRLNGNLFKGIIQHPLGCALFAGLVFYGVVLICISSIL